MVGVKIQFPAIPTRIRNSRRGRSQQQQPQQPPTKALVAQVLAGGEMGAGHEVVILPSPPAERIAYRQHNRRMSAKWLRRLRRAPLYDLLLVLRASVHYCYHHHPRQPPSDRIQNHLHMSTGIFIRSDDFHISLQFHVFCLKKNLIFNIEFCDVSFISWNFRANNLTTIFWSIRRRARRISAVRRATKMQTDTKIATNTRSTRLRRLEADRSTKEADRRRARGRMAASRRRSTTSPITTMSYRRGSLRRRKRAFARNLQTIKRKIQPLLLLLLLLKSRRTHHPLLLQPYL